MSVQLYSPSLPHPFHLSGKNAVWQQWWCLRPIAGQRQHPLRSTHTLHPPPAPPPSPETPASAYKPLLYAWFKQLATKIKQAEVVGQTIFAFEIDFKNNFTDV